MDLRSIQYIDSNGDVLYAEPGQEIVCTPASGSSALVLKSGQTTSYINADDGNEQAGRLIDFFQLSQNNPFLNDLRFTDTLGTQSYANNVVIDWSTYGEGKVLGYFRVLPGNTNWSVAITNASNLYVNDFPTGWRAANVKEIDNILWYRAGIGHGLEYSPFNTTIIGSVSLWSSTTDISNTANAYYYVTSINVRSVIDKTAAGAKYLAVRTFTVNGTTLT